MKNYEIAFTLAATQAASFAKTMSSSAGALGVLQQRMGELGRQEAANERLLKLRDSTKAAHGEFKAAELRAAQLKKVMEATGTREAARDFANAEKNAERLKNTFISKRESLYKLNRELGTASTTTAELVKRNEQLAKSAKAAEKAQENLQGALAAQEANVAKRGALRGQMMDAVALGAALVAPVKLAANWEQNLAELNKVANATPAELNSISQAAQELAVSTGVAREEIIGAYTAAAQAGFDRKEWAQFAEVSAKMGVAFDTTGEKAGEMLKAWRSGMNLTMDEATELAGAANHLANNMNATAMGVGNVLQSQGAVFKAAGLDVATGAGLAAAMLSGGASDEIAATAGKNFVLALSAGAAATSAQSDMMDLLGFDPEDLARQMQEAPQQAIMAVLSSIRALEADEQTAVMSKLFGKESLGAIAPLIGNLENLAGAFALVSDRTEYAASLEAEFNAMQGTTQQQAKKAVEGLKAMATAIGAVLLPPINALLSAAAPLLLSVAQLAQEYPLFTKVLVLGAAALIAGKVAAIAFGYAFTFIKAPILAAQVALATWRTAALLATGATIAHTSATKSAIVISKAMTAAQWLFNAALTANPIGLVVAGIAALITAGVLLYKNFESVSSFFKGMWQGVKQGLEPVIAIFSAFTPIIELVKMAVGALGNAFSWLFGKTETTTEGLQSAASYGEQFGKILAGAINLVTFPIRALIAGISLVAESLTNIAATTDGVFGFIKGVFMKFTPLGWIMSAFSGVTSFLTSIDWSQSGAAILDTLINGITGKAREMIESVKEIFAKVREYLPFSDAKLGPFSELTASGAAIMTTLGEGMRQAGPEALSAPLSHNADNALSRNRGARGVVAASGTGGVTISIKQEIHLGAGGADTYNQARQGAAAGADDLITKINGAIARERRLSYA